LSFVLTGRWNNLAYKKYNDYNKDINGIQYKKCKICEEWLEANIDNFGKNKNSKDGLNESCRKCRTEKGRENYLLNKIKYEETIADKISRNELYNKDFNEYIVEGDITKIIINYKEKQMLTIIDTEDLEKVKSFGLRWCINNSKDQYVKATKWEMINGKPKLKSYYLHILLAGIKKSGNKILVDHKDHDILNNRKENFRIVTNSQNLRNRKGKNKNNKSGYRNVCWIKDQWCVQLMVDGKNTRLGYFDDVEEAAVFAEEMRQKYYKEYAGLGEKPIDKL